MDTAIIIFLLLPNTPLFSAGPAKYRLNADALMRGRPLSLTIYYHALRDFNPRPLAGATGENILGRERPPISIHAPSRGRLHLLLSFRRNGQFQSTPPCGGDRDAGPVGWYRSNFNPRPIAGATCPFLILSAIRSIFQSTPPRGGDVRVQYLDRSQHDFNPRPLAGETMFA